MSLNGTMDSYHGGSEHLSTPKAAYIHVPFCHARCPYCNFTVVANRLDLVDRYVDAIVCELSTLGRPLPMNTIFIGGGTPTLLPREPMIRFVESLRRWLPIENEGEWSIEANPQDVDQDLCCLLRDQGINRISLGGQSFDPMKLKVLGRDHTGEQLKNAIEVASRWFNEVSVDLIFGVPGEDMQVWRADLEKATSLGVSHLSAYALTYEKGAHFWAQREKGQIVAVPEETELEMYLYAIEFLTLRGLNHYEVSNFAIPGSESVHNQTYWRCDPWLGFGPGAAAYVDGTRSVNHRSTFKYLERIESGQSAIAESQTLDWSTRTRERFIFGMRQLKGVDWHSLTASGEPRSIEAIAKQIPKHIALGFMEWHGDHIRLTPQGLPISDSLWIDYW